MDWEVELNKLISEITQRIITLEAIIQSNFDSDGLYNVDNVLKLQKIQKDAAKTLMLMKEI